MATTDNTCHAYKARPNKTGLSCVIQTYSQETDWIYFTQLLQPSIDTCKEQCIQIVMDSSET